MHRHGYKGRKFGRERDQRRALRRGLIISLVEHGSIVTTVQKAKDIRPVAEKLITKARKGGLANRRAIIARLNVDSANRLVDVIAPSLKRESGYLQIEKLGNRVGDNAELASISFVDEIVEQAKPSTTAEPKEEVKAAPAKEGDK